jgi:hypothetical protein
MHRLYKIERDEYGDEWTTCLGTYYTYDEAMEALEYEETEEADIIQNDIANPIVIEGYLRTAFYPPLPVGYVDPAMDALYAADRGDYGDTVYLPATLDPVPRTAWRTGENEPAGYWITAGDLIEALRLY